jgi:hypothetical protein
VKEAANHEREIKKNFRESCLGQNQAPTSKFGPSQDGSYKYLLCAAAHKRYLGCKQRLKGAVNDRIGVESEKSISAQ